jgi:hypothetical protein
MMNKEAAAATQFGDLGDALHIFTFEITLSIIMPSVRGL